MTNTNIKGFLNVTPCSFLTDPHTTRRHIAQDPNNPPSIPCNCLYPRRFHVSVQYSFLASSYVVSAFFISSSLRLLPLTNKLTTSNKFHRVMSFLRSHQLFNYSRISQHMQLEGSLPCSQEPSIGLILSQNNPVYATSCCLSKILSKPSEAAFLLNHI
jgi:hypothetical protein